MEPVIEQEISSGHQMIRDQPVQARPLKDRNAQKSLWYRKSWQRVISVLCISLLSLTSQTTYAAIVPAGDLAPYGIPDGQLNAADIFVLKRAVQGQITLPPISLEPDAPTLTTASGTTNNNPFTVTGTATPGITVNLYVNGQQQDTTTANVTDGSFTFVALLIDSANELYATVWDGTGESSPSASVSITYDNIISRTLNSTVISQNTVWTPGSTPTPYVIAGNLTVDAGYTLTLQPGTELRFEDGAGLVVNGTLTMQGKANNLVTFTSNSISPYRGIWAGIRINATGSGSIIDYVFIEYAAKGIDVDGASVTISNSIIINFGGNWGDAGIAMRNGADGTIVSNTIFITIDPERNEDSGIFLENASPTISGNTIYSTVYGIYVYLQSNPIINEWNSITLNSYGLLVEGDNTNASNNPNPVVNYSTIEGNTSYDYLAQNFSDNSLTLGASFNWWGAVSLAEIISKIYDFTTTGDMSSPVVNVIPFLDGQNGNVVPPANYVSGTLSVNTVFSSDTQYEVLGDLIIPAGITLTIQGGATLLFAVDAQLIVNGTLIIQGSQSKKVVLTSALTTKRPGDWGGIVINSSATGVVIDYAVVEYASSGITFDTSTGTVSNSVIRNNTNGIYIYKQGTPNISSGNVITDNDYGIYALGTYLPGNNPNPILNGNQIYNNSSYNYYSKGFYDATNTTLDASNNWWGTDQASDIFNGIYTNYLYGPAKITFTPFLDAPNGDLVTGNYLYGSLANGTILDDTAPYEVFGYLIIPVGATVTIDAGAVLRFAPGSSLQVRGALLVTGSPTNPVLFTSINMPVVKGSWIGLSLFDTNSSITIDYAILDGAWIGVFDIVSGNTSVVS